MLLLSDHTKRAQDSESPEAPMPPRPPSAADTARSLARAAGVARVGRRVRLDHLPRHTADDPGRDRAVEAVRAAHEQELVAGPRPPAVRVLPERRRPGRLGVDPDHGEIVLRVDRCDLAAPRAALAGDRDA